MPAICQLIRTLVEPGYSAVKFIWKFIFGLLCNWIAPTTEQYGRRLKWETMVRTRDLVSMLAAGVAPVDHHILGKRFGGALLFGMLGATGLLVAIYGVRSDMSEMLATPWFWLKLAFPLSVMVTALFITGRLARPGTSAVFGWLALAVPLCAVWLAAAGFLMAAPPGLRLGLVLGNTWHVCTVNIVLLSVPTFIAIFWAMRGLAPTRLVLAGAGAGLLAGAQAALVYTLYCVEMAPPFWGVWYVLGMLVPTVVGGMLGPRLLRW